jgi:pimeloyl-ACP methyl ester carboxylesterase
VRAVQPLTSKHGAHFTGLRTGIDLAQDGQLVLRRERPTLRAVWAAGRALPNAPLHIAAYFELLASGFDEVKARLQADPLTLKVVHLRALASLASARLAQPVEQITTPILVLHGADDTIFPLAYVQDLYDRLTCPKALRVYEGYDHFLLTERPTGLVDDVVTWLEAPCS